MLPDNHVMCVDYELILFGIFYIVSDSNQEDLCGRTVGEHNYRRRQAVL